MSRITKDWEWTLDGDQGKGAYSYPSAQLSVLMDIRDELKRLNNVLQCPNFIAVPQKLDNIRAELRQVRLNTRKRKRPKVAVKPRLTVVR